MKNDLTDITIVLDRSGSMESVKADTIGGFNAFLADQQSVPGDATLTLIQFDTEYQINYEGTPIKSAPKLTNKTFVPRGGTALLDAIGQAVTTTGARLAALPDADRPGKVLLAIMTDGDENSSREFTREKVFEMLSHQQDKYQWQVVFIGANQDAIKTGAGLGIASGNTMSYAATGVGTRAVAASLSANTARYRNSAGKNTKNFFAPDPADIAATTP